MTRVKVLCVGVYEIIRQDDLVHAVHPVKRKIITGLEIAAHPHKAR